jgi:hypothetical protein
MTDIIEIWLWTDRAIKKELPGDRRLPRGGRRYLYLILAFPQAINNMYSCYGDCYWDGCRNATAVQSFSVLLRYLSYCQVCFFLETLTERSLIPAVSRHKSYRLYTRIKPSNWTIVSAWGLVYKSNVQRVHGLISTGDYKITKSSGKNYLPTFLWYDEDRMVNEKFRGDTDIQRARWSHKPPWYDTTA